MVCSKLMENINELLKYFKETVIEEIKVIVEWIPLATCVANMGEGFRVNQFPMISRDDMLIGHIAFANTIHKVFKNGCKAVFIFKAENSYVSSN